MIRSMTGYGSADLERDGQRLTAEIRSVNHRFCEVSVRAPKVVGLFEDQIRQLISERFSRGKFNLTITWSGAGESGEVLKLNEAVADRYVALLEAAAQALSASISGLDLRTLAGAAGRVRRGSTPRCPTRRPGRWSNSWCWAACDNMNAMKAREGAALAKDLEERLKLIRQHLDIVAERAPVRPHEAKERLMTRVKTLLADVEMDPVRIAQEVALMVDRLDCTEECVRLSAHLDQFRSLIEGSELAGRKLNFLLQEMNREANTIGSKSNDVEITRR